MRISEYWNAIKYRAWYFRNKPKFKRLGQKSFINKPLSVGGPENISIGNNVYIGYKSWIAAVGFTGEKECLLEFGDGCVIGNFNHIYATKRIVFGKKVLTADRVYISDNLHEYRDTSVPIMDQPIRQINEVHIGDGTWIGENVCIIGASVGRNCVIGANAVVTRDIPDYSVAVGSPAKIIKQYCFETDEWKNV